MSARVTLADILARGVSVPWYEGVALSRAVTERLRDRSGAKLVVPEPHQIVLLPTGEIELTGGSRTTEPVRRLGQLLQAVLGSSEPPAQLQLVISRAMAPTPTFASIREYDDAVGYFERPNRPGLLQELYARAAAAPPASPSTRQLNLDTLAPLPLPEAAKKKTPRTKKEASIPGTSKWRRRIVMAMLLVALVVTSVAGFRYARAAGRVPTPAEIAALREQATRALDAAVLSGISAMTEAAGFGRVVAVDTGFGEPPAKPAPPIGSPPRAGAAAIPPKVEQQYAVFDLDPVPALREGAAAPAPVPSTAAPSREASAETEEAPDPTIYSQDSEGVVPAVGIRPQFTQEVPPDLDAVLGRVEVVVGTDGKVESIRLVGIPRNVIDSLLLSAIKAWQFIPASKDGRPIRYRKTVWIAVESGD
jgi:hypothetical protein